MSTSFVSAQDNNEEPLGSITNSVYYTESTCPTGQMCPNSNVQQSLPGGGQGIITSGLVWWHFRIEGHARTEVQSTIYTWQITTTAYLYNNNSFVASAGPSSKSSSGANDSVAAMVARDWPTAGAYWSNEAIGSISNPSLMTWNNSVIAGVNL